MNIILIPGNTKGANVSLTHVQALVFAVALIFVPALVGVVAYRMVSLWRLPAPEIAVLRQEQAFLHYERSAVARAQSNASDHLDALAQRVGLLQAQMMRLNALGSQLAQMAGVPKTSFDFKEEPPLGGPEMPLAAHQSVPDFMAALGTLEQAIAQKQARLGMLKQLLIQRKVVAAVTPAGWPVHGGWISSPFGARIDPFTGRPSFHPGIDIADATGTRIHAMAAGVVTYAGDDGGYGNLIKINDGNGRTTYYGHTSKVLVTEGQLVKKGQVIGLVGSTGRSTGPHLHFEVRQNGDPVNAARYLHAISRQTIQ